MRIRIVVNKDRPNSTKALRETITTHIKARIDQLRIKSQIKSTKGLLQRDRKDLSQTASMIQNIYKKLMRHPI